MAIETSVTSTVGDLSTSCTGHRPKDIQKQADLSAEEEPVTIKVDKKWSDPKASFSIVSSDRVRFFVPKFYLQAAGSVFRDLLETTGKIDGTAGKDELVLTDEWMETSTVLQLFLRVMANHTPAKHRTDSPATLCEDIIRAHAFAVKYDCVGVPTNLRLWLSHAMRRRKMGHVDLFVIGACIDYKELAASAVLATLDNKIAQATNPALKPAWMTLGGDGIFNLDNLSPEMWKRLPKCYIHALHSARLAPNASEASQRFVAIVEDKNAAKKPNDSNSDTSDGESDTSDGSEGGDDSATQPEEVAVEEEAEKEYHVHPDWNDESAGFCIVSSDDWKFWVETYHLQASGSVLRDMLSDRANSLSAGEPEAKNELQMSDANFETSDTISVFLDVLVHGTPTDCFARMGLDRREVLVGVWRFAEKYDCDGVRRIIAWWLGNALRTGTLAQCDVFVLACCLGLQILAADIVELTHGSVRVPNTSAYRAPWGQLLDPGHLNLTCLTDDMWKRLGRPYLHALQWARRASDAPDARTRFMNALLKHGKDL